MLKLARRAFKSNSATAAVEFAFVAPLFILLTFGLIVFGTVISTYNAIQQLAAEAARASLSGTTNAERDQLARSFIANALSSYPFISAANLAVTTASDVVPPDFKVTLTYNMSQLFVFNLGGFVPLPSPTLTRTSVVLVTS